MPCTRTRTRIGVAALLTIVLAATAACSDDGPGGGSRGGAAPSAEASAAPRLDTGSLYAVTTATPPVGRDIAASRLVPGVVSSATQIAVVTAPAGTVRMYDRRTLAEQWTLPMEPGAEVCGPTAFVTPDVLVVPTTLDGSQCQQLLVIEAPTGDLLRKETSLKANFGGSNQFYYSYSGPVRVGDRYWFATDRTLGYFDPTTARTTIAMDADEGARLLGLGEYGEIPDPRRISGLSALPDGKGLLLSMIRDDISAGYFAAVDVSGDEPVVRGWQFGEPADVSGNLGAPGISGRATIVVPDAQPGDGIVLARVEDRTVPAVAGAYDPATGRLRAAITQPTDRVLSVFEALPRFVYAVADDRLITGSRAATAGDTAPPQPRTEVVAYDLGTGRQAWTASGLRAPTTDISAASVTDIRTGDDGQVYALLQDRPQEIGTLNRIDPETGVVSATWDIPADLTVQAGTAAHVIDDVLVLPYESSFAPTGDRAVAPVVFLRARPGG